jgi:type IV pilus assembly protein PilC
MKEKSAGTKKMKRLSYDEQSVFCRQIAFVVKSGIPLSNAYNFLIAESGDDENTAVIKTIFNNIEEGGNFSEALMQTGYFSDYLVSVLALGEKTGNLEQSLNELADYYEQMQSINRKVHDAFTYPLILFTMMLAVILFLIIVVMPQFASIISSAGGQLTASAATILNFGTFLKDNYLYILAVLIILIAALTIYFKSNSGKRLRDRMSFYLPYVRGITKKLSTARFCAAMKMALSCGNGFTTSIELTNDIISSTEVKTRLLQVKQQIENGEEVSKAVAKSELFPSSFIILFTTSYKTGNLVETLDRMSTYYQDSFDDAIYNFISKIEPALVIALSCIAGILLFSIMLPIINIMQMIS